MQEIPMIVITGGPCGGKSTLMVRIREWLEKHDIHPLIISETATELITAGASPQVLGLEQFQRTLLTYSLDRENHYIKMAGRIQKKNPIVICDRGVRDCEAYMGTESFARMLSELGHTRESLTHRYRQVIHLVTAADGAEEYYTLSNNAARSESPETARELDQKTLAAWLGHPHHVIIDNSTDFATKMHRALCALARTLHMPGPTEIERKFKVLNFKPEFIPPEAAIIGITQDYLTPRGHIERRVRQRVHSGETTYFYTEKTSTPDSAKRGERERQISFAEYSQFLEEKDVSLKTVIKVRHSFPFAGKLFELDVFGGKNAGLVILEVELQNVDDPISLPKDWDTVEVTDNPSYRNHALAKN